MPKYQIDATHSNERASERKCEWSLDFRFIWDIIASLSNRWIQLNDEIEYVESFECGVFRAMAIIFQAIVNEYTPRRMQAKFMNVKL